MLKIAKDCWAENANALKEHLTRVDLRRMDYIDYVRMTFDWIFEDAFPKMDTKSIGEIVNTSFGVWHGINLYVVPTDSQWDSMSDILITYANYGSCEVCDIVLGIKDQWNGYGKSDEAVGMAFQLCAHIVQHTMKPYIAEYEKSDDAWTQVGWDGDEDD